MSSGVLIQKETLYNKFEDFIHKFDLNISVDLVHHNGDTLKELTIKRESQKCILLAGKYNFVSNTGASENKEKGTVKST